MEKLDRPPKSPLYTDKHAAAMDEAKKSTMNEENYLPW